jgi:hypothetical protein
MKNTLRELSKGGSDIYDRSQQILRFVKTLPPTGELKWNDGWLNQHCCTEQVFRLLQLLAAVKRSAAGTAAPLRDAGNETTLTALNLNCCLRGHESAVRCATVEPSTV